MSEIKTPEQIAEEVAMDTARLMRNLHVALDMHGDRNPDPEGGSLAKLTIAARALLEGLLDEDVPTAMMVKAIKADRAQDAIPYCINVWDGDVYGSEPGHHWALYPDDPETGADTSGGSFMSGTTAIEEFHLEDDWLHGFDAMRAFALFQIEATLGGRNA